MILFAFAATAALRVQSQAGKEGATSSMAASQSAGRRIFASTCAACHGLDGHGSERAPDILARAELQRMSESEIARVVRDGIPAKRMPAFGGTLETAQIRDASAYLRSLMHGRPAAVPLPGDPRAGKSLFFGKAGCSECHMVEGSGGFLAEDLSSYGRSHSADEIRDAITDPAKNPGRGEKQVVVVTREGEQFSGVARNEDNFSIQVQTADGAFHLLMKADLAKIDASREPLMPADYTQKLSTKELNDVVSYLMRAAERIAKSDASGAAPKPADDD